MKILHVINGLTSGGAEKLVCDIVTGNYSQNIKFEVLTLSDRNDVYSNLLKENNIPIHNITNHSVYNLFILVPLFIFFHKNKYDIIHVHLFPSLYYISILKKIKVIKCNVIFHEHNTENRRNKYIIFKYIDKFIYSSYNRVICISEAVKEKIIERKLISENKAIVIHNGVNINKCKNAIPVNRNQISPLLTENDILLIMVARFTEQKDHKTLLKALKLLPNNYKLCLLGEGEKLDETILYSESLGIRNRVYFLGYNPNVYSYIKASDIFVLSSNWEGFGLVSVESMACGCPVIASNVKGLKDIVYNAGLLFSPHNELELANKIIEVSTNKTLYIEIKHAGFNRGNNFSIEFMLSKLESLYLQIENE